MLMLLKPLKKKLNASKCTLNDFINRLADYTDKELFENYLKEAI